MKRTTLNAFRNLSEEIDIWFSLIIVLKGDEDKELNTLCFSVFKGHVESVWKSYGLFLYFSVMKV